MITAYSQLLRECSSTAFWAILLTCIAAATEGAALATLVPILDTFGNSAVSTRATWMNSAGISSDRHSVLMFFLTLFIALALLSALARLYSNVFSLSVRTQVEQNMREQMTDALLRMNWAHFVSMKQGDISKAMVMEGFQVALGTQHVVTVIGSAIATLCYLIIAWFISPELTLISIIFGGIGGGLYIIGSSKVRKYADSLSQIASEIGDRSAEIFGNLKYFRSVGQEHEARSRSTKLFKKFADYYFKSQAYNPALRGGVEILAAIFVAGFLYFQLEMNNGSVAEVIVFLAVFYRMAPRILDVQSSLFQARTYMTWLNTFNERLTLARTYEGAEFGRTTPSFNHSLKLHGVSFAYPESNRLAVKNINIEIFKGECIALVGPSGGGKSTITDLITGLLVPQEGEVRIDGENLRTLDVNVWRQRIGIVMQDSLILHSSISENVAFGESDEVDREQVIVALKQAHAWEFVSKLPEGIDTVVAERGARLSGGQRQRIAIARALYRKPDLLILDEATSALDGFAEEKVQQAIEEMRGKISIVLVAHRLNTVKMADRIIVMNNGEISESGKWGDLIASRGFFSEMAKLQGAPIKSADR